MLLKIKLVEISNYQDIFADVVSSSIELENSFIVHFQININKYGNIYVTIDQQDRYSLYLE